MSTENFCFLFFVQLPGKIDCIPLSLLKMDTIHFSGKAWRAKLSRDFHSERCRCIANLWKLNKKQDPVKAPGTSTVSDAVASRNHKRAQEPFPVPLPDILQCSIIFSDLLQFPVVICIRIDNLRTGSVITGSSAAFCSRAPALAG